MNRKLHRVLDEIQKTEKKIAEWQEHLKELKLLEEQLENEEIIKTIRSMKLDSHQMLELLEGIQDGTVSIPIMAEGPEETDGKDGTKPEEDMEEKAQETAPESEDRKHEEIKPLGDGACGSGRNLFLHRHDSLCLCARPTADRGSHRTCIRK